jgi:hypothetical protein
MTNFNDYVTKTIIEHMNYRDEEIKMLENMIKKFSIKCGNYDQDVDNCQKYFNKLVSYGFCYSCKAEFCNWCGNEQNNAKICINPTERRYYERHHLCIKCNIKREEGRGND